MCVHISKDLQGQAFIDGGILLLAVLSLLKIPLAARTEGSQDCSRVKWLFGVFEALLIAVKRSLLTLVRFYML